MGERAGRPDLGKVRNRDTAWGKLSVIRLMEAEVGPEKKGAFTINYLMSS